MANHNAILTAVYNKLSALTLVKEICYAPYTPDEFPGISLDYVGDDNEAIDEANNVHTYNFTALLIMEINEDVGMDKPAILPIIMTALDELTDAFNKDYTLGGVVDNVIPTVVSAEYSPIKSGNAKIITVNIKCVKREFIK